jgi:hypothetical protein
MDIVKEERKQIMKFQVYARERHLRILIFVSIPKEGEKYILQVFVPLTYVV